MIPNTKHRSLESSGVALSSEFGISLKDSAHIMVILRDTLYSDKVLAVLREYSANAWDAHRMVGKGDVPIKVVIPTHMEPTLTIRDYGPGLSHEDVFNVYTQYGSSTKRDSDSAVGMLGIGSKSGFAYSDQFTVTSYHKGMKRTYVAVLDKSDKGVINLLHEEPTDETGVEIQIAVRQEDINEFTGKAEELYKYFSPRPDINIPIPELPNAKMSLKHGVIYEDSYDHEWVAVMGCIPYRINLDQIRGVPGAEEGVSTYLHNMSGALYLEIGDVHVNASREELKYSTLTKEAIVKKFDLLIQEFVDGLLSTIANNTSTPWEKRLQGQVLARLHLPVPDACFDLISERVDLGVIPPTFDIMVRESKAKSIRVTTHSRIILRNDKRTLRGFGLGEYDYVVYPIDSAPWHIIEAELNAHLESLGLRGIPILKTSEMTWVPKASNGRGKTFNAKHQVRTFRYIPGAPYKSRSRSQNWDIEERAPTKDDVFVILESFESVGYNFYSLYSDDSRIAKLFGVTLPEVYGYKTTSKLPVTAQDCLGTSYDEWRKEWIKTFNTPANLKIIQTYNWSRALATWYNSDTTDKKVLKKLKDVLGDTHPIYEFIHNHNEASKEIKKISPSSINETFRNLIQRLGLEKQSNEAEVAMDALLDKYPLMKVQDGLLCLWKEYLLDWLDYIKLVDSAP